MNKSGKPRWRIVVLLVLGAAIAAAVALQTRRYLDTPSDAGKTGDIRKLRIDATDAASVAQVAVFPLARRREKT